MKPENSICKCCGKLSRLRYSMDICNNCDNKLRFEFLNGDEEEDYEFGQYKKYVDEKLKSIVRERKINAIIGSSRKFRFPHGNKDNASKVAPSKGGRYVI